MADPVNFTLLKKANQAAVMVSDDRKDLMYLVLLQDDGKAFAYIAFDVEGAKGLYVSVVSWLGEHMPETLDEKEVLH